MLISKEAQPFAAAVLLLVIVLGYGWYEYDRQSEKNFALMARVGDLEAELQDTEKELQRVYDENEKLTESLNDEQDKVRSIENTVDEVTDIVGDLQKLEKIEPELLQKYSKVYFLNEHYTPKKLRDVDTDYVYYEDRDEQVDSRALPFLEDMLEEAEDDGVDLFVYSAYRSFGEQGSLKAGYTVTYGSGANAFSADQGYSEHQLGTTVDFITTGISGTLAGFGETEAFKWLEDNAYKYGFVLSYPEGNAYYIYEPWHWRFVGKELAERLEDESIYFYDLPQQVIDTYRLELFDR